MNSTDTTTVYNDSTTASAYRYPFDETGIIIAAAILIPLMIIGIIGNTLTICVLSSEARLRNIPFNRIIISLCCSDLLSALISWLHLYRRTWGFDVWSPIPKFLCKFYWGADIMTNFATAMHIFTFAVIRYISLTSKNLYGAVKNRHVTICIALIWIVSFTAGMVPWCLYTGATARDRSSGKANARWPSCTILEESIHTYDVLTKITYPIFLLAPAVGVFITSIMIPITVRRRTINLTNEEANTRRRKKERQAVAQLMLITSTFLLGYIPFVVYEYWGIQDHPDEYYYHQVDYWLGFGSYMMLRFSECLNPIIYNLGSERIRRSTIRFLQEHVICCLMEPADSVSTSTPGKKRRFTSLTRRRSSVSSSITGQSDLGI